jgi:hypothetical protein
MTKTLKFRGQMREGEIYRTTDLPCESESELEPEVEDAEESEPASESDKEDEDFGGFVARDFLAFLGLGSEASELESELVLVLEWLESSDDAIWIEPVSSLPRVTIKYDIQSESDSEVEFL